MARKFVRNITGTKLKGENKEPLKTNMQNDLLSDDEDVYVRNKDDYHCLTDNLKDLTTSTPSIVTIKNGKNSSNIDVKETKLESESEIITINNPNPNDFKINIDLSNYALIKDLNNHIEDYNNPHKVNLEDLGIENLPETVTNIENNLEDLNNKVNSGKIVSQEILLKLINPITSIQPRGFFIKKDGEEYQIMGELILISFFKKIITTFDLYEIMENVNLGLYTNLSNKPSVIGLLTERYSTNGMDDAIKAKPNPSPIKEGDALENIKKGYNSFCIIFETRYNQFEIPITIPIVEGGLSSE